MGGTEDLGKESEVTVRRQAQPGARKRPRAQRSPSGALCSGQPRLPGRTRDPGTPGSRPRAITALDAPAGRAPGAGAPRPPARPLLALTWRERGSRPLQPGGLHDAAVRVHDDQRGFLGVQAVADLQGRPAGLEGRAGVGHSPGTPARRGVVLPRGPCCRQADACRASAVSVEDPPEHSHTEPRGRRGSARSAWPRANARRCWSKSQNKRVRWTRPGNSKCPTVRPRGRSAVTARPGAGPLPTATRDRGSQTTLGHSSPPWRPRRPARPAGQPPPPSLLALRPPCCPPGTHPGWSSAPPSEAPGGPGAPKPAAPAQHPGWPGAFLPAT